jgi:hypothetical protein
VRAAQRKHILAAHEIIHQHTEAMVWQSVTQQLQEEGSVAKNSPTRETRTEDDRETQDMENG